MALPLTYNVRSVAQRPLATLTTALGVGLTVAIFIGALGLAAGFRQALRRTGSPDNALVLRQGADSEISSSVSRAAVSVLRAHPGVAVGPDGRPLLTADLVVITNRPRRGQPGSSNLTVRGVDPAGVGVRAELRLADGRMFSPGTDEVVVGRRLPGRFAGLGLGDRVVFGQRAFRVVGHFAAGGAAFESEIWGDAAVLGPALDRDGVFQTVTFRMRDPGAFAALERELEADPRLQVQLRRESDFYAEQTELFTGLVTAIGVFITAIMGIGAVFGAANTMYAAVGARTREIATLLVLGFTPRAVLVSFVLESVLVALLGGVIGCLLALPLNGVATSTTNFQSFSELAFAFRITPGILLAGLAAAAAMGLVGGFLPALKAARQPLAAALRGA